MATFLVNTTVTIEFLYNNKTEIEGRLEHVAHSLWGEYPFEVVNLILDEKLPLLPYTARAELVRLKEHPGIEFVPLD